MDIRCKECGILLNDDNWRDSAKKDNYRKCTECLKNKAKKYRSKLKETIFDYYGRECIYFGSNRDLQIDHVNGDGHKHKKKISEHRPNKNQASSRVSSTEIYYDIIKNNFPNSFQTVCKICNVMKGTLTEDEWFLRMKMILERNKRS